MKFIILLSFTLVYVNLAEANWFSYFIPSSSNVFPEVYSRTNEQLEEKRKELQDKSTKQAQSLPTFTEGTLGHYMTNMISIVKNTVVSVITGTRYAVSELKRFTMETSANVGVDLLLLQYKLIARTTGVGNEIPLPDIDSPGRFYSISATGGYFRSLSSLEKSAKIKVTIVDSNSALIEVPMRFQQMEVGYKNVTVSYLISGSFTINIANNSLTITLRVGMDSTCVVRIENVTINEFQGITVNYEGMSSVGSYIIASVTNTLIYYTETVIKGQIQSALDTNLKTALGNGSVICSAK